MKELFITGSKTTVVFKTFSMKGKEGLRYCTKTQGYDHKGRLGHIVVHTYSLEMGRFFRRSFFYIIINKRGKGKVCIRDKWPIRPELIPVSVA